MEKGDSVRQSWPVLHLLLFWSGPINLLARLEPETIWKNCRVYKTDMEQHPRALTSHTNLEMIKMALAAFAVESCLQRAAHRPHLEFSSAGLGTRVLLPGALPALPTLPGAPRGLRGSGGCSGEREGCCSKMC